MEKPIVSVICTNFNKSEWIEQALLSILGQKTSFPIEVIIIDDCSTDDSIEKIKKIVDKNDKIIFIQNEKNIGITKTWIKACNASKGKYIARCDGDDYWFDELKLQKQVDLLKNNQNSKWSNTDYRTINEKGEVISNSSFRDGVVKMPNSFTEMLATKGFTNASTWLIDSKLIKEVNAKIDTETSDDTFNIQLELFARTNISFLPDSTTVYRINQGSDSHPRDMEIVKKRNDKLLKTQIEYYEKYKDKVDKDLIIKYLLDSQNNTETALIEANKIVNEQNNQIAIRADFMEEQAKIIKHLKDRISQIENSKAFKMINKIKKI